MSRLLAHEAGREAASADALAAAAGRLFARISQHLSVVIGRMGVEALFRRTVKLRQAEFPFLDEQIVSGAEGEPTGEALRLRLQEQGPDAIREASLAIFATFAGLLVTIVGERLAWSLLREVWPEALRPETGIEETEE